MKSALLYDSESDGDDSIDDVDIDADDDNVSAKQQKHLGEVEATPTKLYRDLKRVKRKRASEGGSGFEGNTPVASLRTVASCMVCDKDKWWPTTAGITTVTCFEVVGRLFAKNGALASYCSDDLFDVLQQNATEDTLLPMLKMKPRYRAAVFQSLCNVLREVKL